MESTRGAEISWRVKGFYRPAYHVLGPGGLFKVLALSFVLLTPGLGFGFYCVWSAQYAALVWALPILFVVLMSRPDLNAIGLALWVIVLCIGLVFAVFFAPVHAVGGFLPGLTWLLFGALQGTTMIAMEELLRESTRAVFAPPPHWAPSGVSGETDDRPRLCSSIQRVFQSTEAQAIPPIPRTETSRSAVQRGDGCVLDVRLRDIDS